MWAFLATQLYCDIKMRAFWRKEFRFLTPLESTACRTMNAAEQRRFAIRKHTIEVAYNVEPYPE
jgi:hypothetical protein